MEWILSTGFTAFSVFSRRFIYVRIGKEIWETIGKRLYIADIYGIEYDFQNCCGYFMLAGNVAFKTLRSWRFELWKHNV